MHASLVPSFFRHIIISQRRRDQRSMQNWALRSTRYLDRVLTILGVGLILLGLVTGWIVPHLTVNWSLIQALQTPVHNSGIDTTTFLGADITTLAVIIAVL